MARQTCFQVQESDARRLALLTTARLRDTELNLEGRCERHAQAAKALLQQTMTWQFSVRSFSTKRMLLALDPRRFDTVPSANHAAKFFDANYHAAPKVGQFKPNYFICIKHQVVHCHIDVRCLRLQGG